MESVAFMIGLSDYGLDVRSFLKIEKVWHQEFLCFEKYCTLRINILKHLKNTVTLVNILTL